MFAFFTTLIIAEITVVAAEAALWFAFRSKAVPISFPHETDASSLRSFTFARLRLLIALHTLVCLIAVALLFFLLW